MNLITMFELLSLPDAMTLRNFFQSDNCMVAKVSQKFTHAIGLTFGVDEDGSNLASDNIMTVDET